MVLSIQDLLTGLIDYAGLFPPAALDMASAVGNYATYRQGENARFLGRFIIPVSALDEFEQAAAGYCEDGSEHDTWLLSALAGVSLDSDLKKIDNFNESISLRRKAIIDSIEIKVERPADIERAINLIPDTLEAYFEVPIAGDPIDLIKTIAATGARAKVRTGGVTADAFPSSFNLARFIKACADEDVPFKATAGLHHPLRSVNKLTYEPDSGMALMHGFLNVFLAAAFAYNGMRVEQLVELLEEKSLEAFQFDSGCAVWRDQMVVRGQLRNARSLFAISFGSCSFDEPFEGLKKIDL
ncbi:MAG: hypothetical protein L0226_15710 [Acidobacteria bacterium]|nr:hypothetical protein [Acidobacteriota bacterium]